MTTANLLTDLQIEEGLRLEAYQDTVGVWTIGYGHTGPEVRPGLVWTLAQAQNQLVIDFHLHLGQLEDTLDWFQDLDDIRQDVLVNMCFNLGMHTLLSFTTFLGLVKAGKYAEAAEDMKTTKWARQVGHRADVLSDMMTSGQHEQY